MRYLRRPQELSQAFDSLCLPALHCHLQRQLCCLVCCQGRVAMAVAHNEGPCSRQGASGVLWEGCPARQTSYHVAHTDCLTGHHHVLQEGGRCLCGKCSSLPQCQGRLHPAPLPRDDAAVCGAASGSSPRLPHHASELTSWAGAMLRRGHCCGLRVCGAAGASLTRTQWAARDWG